MTASNTAVGLAPLLQDKAVTSQEVGNLWKQLTTDADRSTAIRGGPGAHTVEGEAVVPREPPAGPEPFAAIQRAPQLSAG